MKLKIILSLAALVFCLASFAQTNPKLTVNPRSITLADTVAIKIKALQDLTKKQQKENTQLKQQLAEMKTSMNALSTTLNFVANNLNALQSNYTNFTTNVYPTHWHNLNGTAGVGVDADHKVYAQLVIGGGPGNSVDITKEQYAQAEKKLLESLRRTGPPAQAK